MARSKIVITFPESNLINEQYIQFDVNVNTSNNEFVIRWYDSPLDQGVIVGTDDIKTFSTAPFTFPNYDAVKYALSIDNIDYLNYYDVSRVDNVVTIQSRIDGLNFVNPVSNNNQVLFEVTNEQAGSGSTGIVIDNVSILPKDCNNVTLEVNTTPQATKITSPFSQNITSNPFNFDYLRGQEVKIIVEDGDGNIAVKKIQTPAKLLVSNVNVDIVNLSSTDNTVTINYNSLLGNQNTVLTYSVNGVDFSSNNVFNLNEGSYTAYVKDTYGCVVSKDFEVVNTNQKKPFFFISKTNALRFASREERDNVNTYKTDENTLSCEVLDFVKHKQVQRFQTNDIISTQIQSNYNTIEAFVIDGETETPITINKVRGFLNKKDSRDGVVFKTSNGKAGVYFDAGKIYDYDTGLEIGSHNMNGARPSWMRVGRGITIEDIGTLEIKRTWYNEDLEKQCLEVDYNFTDTPQLKVIKSIYNAQPFDLYEFNADFSSFEDKCVRVKIVATDEDLENIELLSEVIEVKSIHDDCLEIVYRTKEYENNSEIFYETGISNKLRVPYKKITSTPVSNIEIHKGDTSVSVTDAEYYEGDTIEFLPQTKELAKKLEYALLHSYLRINGVNYVSNEKPDTEQEGDSNLYKVTAKLIKSDFAFTTNKYNQVDNGSIDVDIPSLIIGNNGFISYQ